MRNDAKSDDSSILKQYANENKVINSQFVGENYEIIKIEYMKMMYSRYKDIL